MDIYNITHTSKYIYTHTSKYVYYVEGQAASDEGDEEGNR